MFPLSGNADVSGWDVPVHKLDAVAGLGAEPRKFWPFFACKRTSTVGTSLTGLLVYPAVTLKGSIFRLPRHINSSNKKKTLQYCWNVADGNAANLLSGPILGIHVVLAGTISQSPRPAVKKALSSIWMVLFNYNDDYRY